MPEDSQQVDNSHDQAVDTKGRSPKTSNFSKAQLAVFALSFGIIGFFLAKSFAAGHQPAPAQTNFVAFSRTARAPGVHSHTARPYKVDSKTLAAQKDWTSDYQYVFVKPSADLNTAMANASSHGVIVVSALTGLHAYVATQKTVGRAKSLPETKTANPIIGAPTVVPDGSDVQATASRPITTTGPNVSSPTISGNFSPGGTVYASVANSSGTLTYSWYLCPTSSFSSCSLNTYGSSSAFTIPKTQVGGYVRATVVACRGSTCSSAAGSLLYPISKTAPPPTQSPPANTSLPAVSGTATTGNTMIVSNGQWSNSPTSYKYTWYICSTSSSCSQMASGSASYTIPSGHSGQTLYAGVVACNSAGCSSQANSSKVTITDYQSPPPQQTCSSGSGNQEISVSLVRINARLDKTVSGDGCNSVGGIAAIIDSGITPDSDLNIVGGKNFVNASSSCSSSSSSYADDNGHGTQVASILGSIDDTKEFVGVAPGIKLLSLKTQDSTGSGTFQAMICAVNYAASTRTDSDPSNDVTVVNISLAGTTTDPPTATCATTNEALHLAICAAERLGIVFAAAAGNSSKDFSTTYPATYPEVLTATAMNDYNGNPGGGASPNCNVNDGADDSYATYSNYPDASEQAHTVGAPGTCVHSLTPSNPTYSWWSGTSEASPMVAGLLANCIYWQICSGSAAQIQSKVYNDIYSYDQSHQSYGYNGDPWHLVNGINYGPLINLSLY